MKNRILLLAVAIASSASAADTWSPQTAASYLDSRMDWWTTWKSSARDHDTFCISCHTALPYAMARPELRSALKRGQRLAARTHDP